MLRHLAQFLPNTAPQYSPSLRAVISILTIQQVVTSTAQDTVLKDDSEFRCKWPANNSCTRCSAENLPLHIGSYVSVLHHFVPQDSPWHSVAHLEMFALTFPLILGLAKWNASFAQMFRWWLCPFREAICHFVVQNNALTCNTFLLYSFLKDISTFQYTNKYFLYSLFLF